MTVLHPSVYIPSVQASHLYLHHEYNQPLYVKYVGMLPASLELNELIRQGVVPTDGAKRTSNAIISISFKQAIKTPVEMLADKKDRLIRFEAVLAKLQNKYDMSKNEANKKLYEDKIEIQMGKINSLSQQIEELKTMIQSGEAWTKISNKELRTHLYENGFSITSANGIVTQYKISHRTSAAARTGKVIAIRADLYEGMKNWRRMGLELDGRKDIDFVSVLAYESLTSSSIEEMIEINTNSILVIDKEESKFRYNAILVSLDEEGKMVSKSGTSDFSNEIWDGQALLEEEFFDGEISMKLLRHHWFKAACFRVSVQQFLRDHCPEGIEFDDWYIIDVYNNPIKASSIKMITTESALKFMKVAHVVGDKKQMWKHWCKRVKADGNLFGVVKHEKPSRRMEDNKPVRTLSYQYINSLPITEGQIATLCKYDLEYLDKLKNDHEFFIAHLERTSNEVNGNEMMVKLYQHNPAFIGVDFFRLFKSKKIEDWKKGLLGGKVSVKGADYYTLLSNPIEMLYKAVNMKPKKKSTLKKYQVYCKGYDFDTDLCAMRSPHTAANNVVLLNNTDNALINEYLPNLSKSIVVINCIGVPILTKFSGADMDSDCVYISDSKVLVSVANKCKKYPVVQHDIDNETKPYTVSLTDQAEIDISLCNDFIGSVTNSAALLLSSIWDMQSKGEDTTALNDDLSKLIVMQGLAIDSAKRKSKANIDGELKQISKPSEHPIWWKYRPTDDNKKKAKKEKGKKKTANEVDTEIEAVWNCPMDNIVKQFIKTKPADGIKNVPIKKLLIKREAGKANNNQFNKVIDLLDTMSQIDKSLYRNEQMTDDEKEENITEKLDNMREHIEIIKKMKINANTMYAIISHYFKDNKLKDGEYKRITVIMKVLFEAKHDVFMSSFHKN